MPTTSLAKPDPKMATLLAVRNAKKQVEIKNTWDLPLGTRIKIHLTLLRLLNNGYEIEDAIKIALQSKED